MPDSASLPPNEIDTAWLYQPFRSGPRSGFAPVVWGAVLSILIVTVYEPVRPSWFVAEQVRLAPAVSVMSVCTSQLLVLVMGDSGSAHAQFTVTLLVYQPFDPRVPVMLGVMTGAASADGARA